MAHDPKEGDKFVPGAEDEHIGNATFHKPPERDDNPPPPFGADESETNNDPADEACGYQDSPKEDVVCITNQVASGMGFDRSPCGRPECPTYHPPITEEAMEDARKSITVCDCGDAICGICNPSGGPMHPCEDPECQTCNPTRKMPLFPAMEDIPYGDSLAWPRYCKEDPRCTYIALQKTNELLADILKELRNF